jgi:hypothetical protein
MVKVCISGGGFTYRVKENLHHFGKDFEHKIGPSGGSGGFLSILIAMPTNDKNTDSLVSGTKLY